MNLIQISNRELAPGTMVETVNARDLWEFVESRRQFGNWITERIEKFSFEENVDFTVNKFVNGKATLTDYYISVDMAKQLAMVENNLKGQEVRRYFIECERLAKAKAAVPDEAELQRRLQDPEWLRSLLLQNVEKVLALQSQVAEQKPKVAALDRICTVSDGSMCITDAAKALQVKPKELFAWMRCHDWTYQRQGTGDIAYQPRIKQGFLEHKITTIERKDGTEKIVSQVRVTAKGLAQLAESLARLVMPLE